MLHRLTSSYSYQPLLALCLFSPALKRGCMINQTSPTSSFNIILFSTEQPSRAGSTC